MMFAFIVLGCLRFGLYLWWVMACCFGFWVVGVWGLGCLVCVCWVCCLLVLTVSGLLADVVFDFSCVGLGFGVCSGL